MGLRRQYSYFIMSSTEVHISRHFSHTEEQAIILALQDKEEIPIGTLMKYGKLQDS